MITRQEKLQALEALNYECGTTNGEITSWSDARPQPATWEDIIALAAPIINARQSRATDRTALRAQYMALPKYIRGPMFPAFIAANQLLDLGMDADAAEIIEYAEPPKKFNQARMDEFETARQTFAAAIAALPSLQ